MALTDIHFQEGEGQDFLIEAPAHTYIGVLLDIVIEALSIQYPVSEIPLVTGGGNIFIMSE